MIKKFLRSEGNGIANLLVGLVVLAALVLAGIIVLILEFAL